MIDDPIVTLLLSPLLISQGIYARKMTPKLPEAEGKRQGVTGEGALLKLLILGDSAAARVGVKHQDQALTGQLVTKLSEHFAIDWRLEAETGSTTEDTISKLENMEPFKTDVVVVSLGVNDVTGLVRLNKWLALQQQLKELLTSKFEAKHILLSSIPPMDRFPALPQPLRWYLGRRSKRFNSALLQHTAPLSELEFAHIEFPLTSGFVADDGFHPSHLAYDYWSDITAKRIRHKHK